MAKKHCSKKIIQAVGYCRKSTQEERTEKSLADQKARISTLKPPDENARYEIVKWYEKDAGVPGWKRGASRPDYFRMVGELKETAAKAILVDDMDRFSRADVGETVSDVQALCELGVQFIHACNQGCRDLTVNRTMVFMQIAMEANASHEFSTRLSRRIANARLDAAKQGKRSGGAAPYGLENDGAEGDKIKNYKLKPGDPKKVKVVQRIFKWFVEEHKSMCWIAGELNKQNVPATHGGKWYVARIKELLERRAYRGDFTFNETKTGEFHIIDANQQVVPVNHYQQDGQRKTWRPTPEGMFLKEKVYQPLVDPKLFDAAQKRLASFALQDRRPREGGFALSGILVCAHCGKRMYGSNPTGRQKRIYCCGSSSQTGHGSCKKYWIAESDILPLILHMLGEEIDKITQLREPIPEHLRPVDKQKQFEELEQQVAALKAKIDQATENLMKADERTFSIMDSKIKRLWAEHDKLIEKQGSLDSDVDGLGHSQEQVDQLAAFWDDFLKKAVHVPPAPKKVLAAFDKAWDNSNKFFKDEFVTERKCDAQAVNCDPRAVNCDPRAVNEVLHTLGCKVQLWWHTEQVKLSNGKTQNRYTFQRGRLQMGQKDVKFCTSSQAEA
jgi:DNA invertase Pin-like site-specific DNA recombinase